MTAILTIVLTAAALLTISALFIALTLARALAAAFFPGEEDRP
jgi:hypothetical protein